MFGIYNQQSAALTKDVDFAIDIPNWTAYQDIVTKLVESGLFGKTTIPHRLMYKGKFAVDFVPYGGVQDNNGTYTWPPADMAMMTVLGFSEMADNHHEIVLSDLQLKFKVISLPGLILSKLLAWKDRSTSNTKDGKDIGFLLVHLFDINIELLYANHEDILNAEEFDTFIAGAMIAGRQVREMLANNNAAVNNLCKLLDFELQDNEVCKLAIAISQGASVPYYRALKSLQAFTRELSANI